MSKIVQQRLRYLRNWELANVVLIPAIVWLMWRTTGDTVADWRLRWIGLAFVSYVLLQGGVYWYLKLRMVSRAAGALPLWFAPVFSLLRRTNPVLIASAAAYMLLTNASSATDRAWGCFILALAYVEHVNYFVRQLMHDTAADVAFLRRYRRLRHSPVRRDLDAAQARQRRATGR